MNTTPKTSLKILVCYHKPSILIKDDTFIPIHCGRARLEDTDKDGFAGSEDREWLLNNCIGDDTGENISRENGRFSETTGHFWAWKNYEKLGNPDYIGFMHYRRIFIFPEKDQGEPRIFVPFLTEDEYRHYLNTEDLHLGKYDMYVPQWLPVIKFKISVGAFGWAKNPSGICKVKDQHPGGRGNQEALDYIHRHYPEYDESARDYFEGTKCFQWNMFIFRKELFFEYCQFLFDVLGAVDKQLDFTHANSAEMRITGYIAEHTTGIFILKKIRDGLRVKHLSMFFISDTSLHTALSPTPQKNCISVCCSADNRNTYMCGVMLNSVISHADRAHNYDIVVLEKELSEPRKRKLLSLTEGHPNVTIRFYNITRFTSRAGISAIDKQFPVSYYYYCIPLVFDHYDKVLYLDHNAIARCDVAALFNTELGDHYIAACTDDMVPAGLGSGREDITYYRETLGIHDPYTECVSNGVILFNVKKIRSMGEGREMLDMLEDKDFKEPAEDVLNKWAYKKTLFLEPTWNVCPQWNDSQYLPADDYWKWRQHREQAKILSYRGTVSRPWNNTGLDFAAEWWKYARSTPFYEELLSINTSACTATAIKKALGSPINPDEIKKAVVQKFANKQKGIDMQEVIDQTLAEVSARTQNSVNLSFIRDIAGLETYKKKLMWLKLRLFFSWGRRKQKNRERKRLLERKIRITKDFLKIKE